MMSFMRGMMGEMREEGITKVEMIVSDMFAFVV